MKTARPSRLLIVLAFAAVYLIWGSTYLGIRLAIDTLPGFLMAGTRFTIAGAILFSFAVFSGETMRQSFAHWRRALIVGELAAAVVLLTAAGLMLRSVVSLARLDLGFEARQLLAVKLSPPSSTATAAEMRTLTELLGRISSSRGEACTPGE